MRELIKLAKEKGFDDVILPLSDRGNYLNLCLIQKWLREENGIYVEVKINSLGSYSVVVMRAYGCYEKVEELETYEQALQKGLEDGLKLT